MNYFIDFEATQFSNAIISVGCKAEDGREFYSLVRTSHKITSFITNLTGITKEDIAAAPVPETVFAALYDWCKDDRPHFLCYGNGDKEFVKQNFKDCKDFKAAAMLAYLYADLEDYAPIVKQHFGLCKPIGLNKVYNYCAKKQNEQKHNALEDAYMLYRVYCYIQKHDTEERNVFPEYEPEGIKEKDNAPVYTVYREQDGVTLDIFCSLNAAVKWCFENLMGKQEHNLTKSKTVAKGIKQAYKCNKTYRGFNWRLEQV